MKRFLILLAVLILVGCTAPTPTTSPPPTESPLPTPPVSPIEPPQAEAVGIVVVEKPNQMEENTMNAELLASVAGIALSLVFSYIPGANTWFEALDGIVKRLVMAGLMLLVAAAVYGLSCAGVISGYVECTQAGLMSTTGFFIDAMIANQMTYTISPKLKK